METNLAGRWRLMLIADHRLLGGRSPLAVCRAAVRGGVTCVQLRAKDLDPRAQVAEARALAGGLSVPVYVNDRLDVALASGCAGVHLGTDDLPLGLARRITPPGFHLGASVGSPGEAARSGEADYWGVGPWRGTGTKSDAGPPLGPGALRAIVAQAGPIPCLAIGGVLAVDVAEILGAGAAGVAVGAGILGADDVEAAARAYWVELERPRGRGG